MKDIKISRGFIKTAFKVTEKKTGKHYDCFIQDYKYTDGNDTILEVSETRFNIGINGWREWNFLYYVEEEEFNENFTVD